MNHFIQDVARKAGAIVRSGFRQELQITQKSDAWDLVTEYDVKTEEYIIKRIRRTYPTHGILAEESGHSIRKKNFWIIDPIDGTTAFIRGIAQFSVCIAYVSNNQVRLAAVYDPMADELFFAERGKGAWLSKTRLHIAQRREFRGAWAAHHTKGGPQNQGIRDRIWSFVMKSKVNPMRTGSMQLSGAYTAAGRYDILISKGLNPWDYAACALILKEAGARVTDFAGRPYRWDSDEIVAANPKLHKQLIQVLKTR